MTSSASAFPIVALGASAGGLEACEAFFRAVAADSGYAFVLVSHLDPDHASLLTDILQRSSAMPVVEAQDQLQIEPNHVYVMPPNRDMAIFHGVLQLSVPSLPRGQRMPIDAFLRSLAEDQGEHAVGIILSGTGTDGTLGLRAIQGAGGITLVQDPASAKYEGMPVSAIHAGYATQVLPPEQMPAALTRFQAMSPTQKQEAATKVTAPAGINRILMLLRGATGHDFSQYKKSTIGRRIERRMSQQALTDTDLYARYLKENPAEAKALFKELLINVTSFFRDAEAFALLRQEILPQLLADKPDGYVFRAWVAGCASGEEAYSIAILLREALEETWQSCHQEIKAQLYATDLDEDAIALARAGLYPPNVAADVSPERLRRYFTKEETGYRVKKEIREMVVFAVQNVVKDPPFTRLDLLSCRNLMIYLEPELQNRLLPTFHYALKPDGVLFLSPSEGTGGHPDLFSAISRKWKFYRATRGTLIRAFQGSMPVKPVGGEKVQEETRKLVRDPNFAELTQHALLQSYAPASVVTDSKGNILFVHGETGKYLRPAPGQASFNVIDMAREGLQLELRNALHSPPPILNRVVRVKTNGDYQSVSLSLRSLPFQEGGEGLLLVSFQDVLQDEDKSGPKKGGKVAGVSSRRVAELERDLAYTRENLQATIEEQQASNEELKSANEELQSTNEELQSTNEELETSKEELQSVNEELITVNSELQAKIEQLADMQNDMKNLLDNIHVGTVFLDANLHIRRYTREATKVYRLVATDVGRSLADIKSDATEVDLPALARIVLETLAPCEREVHTLAGESFLARLQPYRTLDNVIDGVVLTFTDISARVSEETGVREAQRLAQAIVDGVREPLLLLDAGLRVVSASRAYYRRYGVQKGEVEGRVLLEIAGWNLPELRELLEQVLAGSQSLENYEIEQNLPGIGPCPLLLNARRLVDELTAAPLILLAMEEVR